MLLSSSFQLQTFPCIKCRVLVILNQHASPSGVYRGVPINYISRVGPETQRLINYISQVAAETKRQINRCGPRRARESVLARIPDRVE